MQECNLLANDVWEVYERRIERFDIATSEVFEKAAQSNEVVCLCDNLEVFGAVFGAVAIEAQSIFTEQLFIYVGRLNIVFVQNFL